MSQLHPIRKVSANLALLSSKAPTIADDEFEGTIATISAVGERLDRMQSRLEEQTALIADLKKEVSDLAMHKEAAYSEMAKSEAALQVERARAERAEQSLQEAGRKEREASERLSRMVGSVRDTFGRVERAPAP